MVLSRIERQIILSNIWSKQHDIDTQSTCNIDLKKSQTNSELIWTIENKGVRILLSFNAKKFDAVSWLLSLLKKMKVEREETKCVYVHHSVTVYGVHKK